MIDVGMRCDGHRLFGTATGRSGLKVRITRSKQAQFGSSRPERIGRGLGVLRQVNILLDRVWTERSPIVPTPGQTPGHVSVIVDDGELSFFLAGDTSYTQQALIEQKVDGVSPSAFVALETLRKIHRLTEQARMV